MNFNLTPYYDDFDPSNDYYRILFRPGVSVQVREMNQLQAILQNQISSMGDNLFKNGAMVIPGQVSYGARYNYLKISSFSLGFDSNGNPLGLNYLQGIDSNGNPTNNGVYLCQNANGTGVKAHVIIATPANSITGDPITLTIKYVGLNQLNDGVNTDTGFSNGATIYVVPPGASVPDPTKTIQVATGVTNNGPSVAAGIQAGVYYFNGTFVNVPTTSIVVQKYADVASNVNARIGLQFTEAIVTPDEIGRAHV